jgi:hypothetical protein
VLETQFLKKPCLLVVQVGVSGAGPTVCDGLAVLSAAFASKQGQQD